LVSLSLTAIAVATVESKEVIGDWTIWSSEDVTIFLFLEYRNRETTGKSCSLKREEAEIEQDVWKQRIRNTAQISYKDSSFE
jgi:hypothetical protein